MNIRRVSYDVGFKVEGKPGNAHTLATFRDGRVFEISTLSLMEDIGRSGLHLNRSGMYIFTTALRTAVATEIGLQFLPQSVFKS